MSNAWLIRSYLARHDSTATSQCSRPSRLFMKRSIYHCVVAATKRRLLHAPSIFSRSRPLHSPRRTKFHDRENPFASDHYREERRTCLKVRRLSCERLVIEQKTSRFSALRPEFLSDGTCVRGPVDYLKFLGSYTILWCGKEKRGRENYSYVFG